VSFIEVLFALVVARTLDPFAHHATIPGVGLSHLGVAFVLTVTSWIGYHNSLNRPRYFIRFANLPLWQFTVDVLLVVTYWFCAVSAEGTGSDLGQSRSALPEAVTVATAFILYCIWDWVGYSIRKSDLYPRRPADRDVPRRRYVTIAFAAAAIAFAMCVWMYEPRSDRVIIGADIALIALIIVYRFTKEAPFVTPEDAQPPSAPEDPSTEVAPTVPE
jgi:hypothetical protein